MMENRRGKGNVSLEIENLELKAAVEGKESIIRQLQDEVKVVRESKMKHEW